MQKKLILLRCIDQTVRNEMAASQNPIQGSLFGGNEHSDINEADNHNSEETSNGNLSHQQLQEDASLRPRTLSSIWLNLEVCLPSAPRLPREPRLHNFTHRRTLTTTAC